MLEAGLELDTVPGRDLKGGVQQVIVLRTFELLGVVVDLQFGVEATSRFHQVRLGRIYGQVGLSGQRMVLLDIAEVLPEAQDNGVLLLSEDGRRKDE